MSSHGIARASRSAISAVRAWNTSAFTFSGGHPITAGDLRMAEIAQLEQHQRAALVLGQPGEVGDQLAQVGAAPDVLGQAVVRRLELVGGDRGVAARGQQRAAAVAGDREQPRPHGVGRPAVAQRAMRAQERLLERVLTVLAVADHVAAEREQRGVMAVVERLERALVAVARARRGARRRAGESGGIPVKVQHSQDAARPGYSLQTDQDADDPHLVVVGVA